jgi:flagellar motility protein MotE (MotC chaperone)
MMRIFQSSWFVALTGCLLYLATTVWVLNSAEFPMMQNDEADLSATDDPSWRFHNPEFDQWLAQIKAQKESLDAREQSLNQLQTRLNVELQEVSAATQTVSQLQADFDKNVIIFTAQEASNIKRQVKLISSMSPEGAVAMLGEMPDETAVRILFTMKSDDASQILDAMSKKSQAGARRAADLTEQLHRILPTGTNSVAKP